MAGKRKAETPEAKGRRGARGKFSVPRCPFCGHSHEHSFGDGRDTLRRESPCGGGEYHVNFK